MGATVHHNSNKTLSLVKRGDQCIIKTGFGSLINIHSATATTHQEQINVQFPTKFWNLAHGCWGSNNIDFGKLFRQLWYYFNVYYSKKELSEFGQFLKRENALYNNKFATHQLSLFCKLDCNNVGSMLIVLAPFANRITMKLEGCANNFWWIKWKALLKTNIHVR